MGETATPSNCRESSRRPFVAGWGTLRHPTQPDPGLRLEGRSDQAGTNDDRVHLRVPGEGEGEVAPDPDPDLEVRRQHFRIHADGRASSVLE